MYISLAISNVDTYIQNISHKLNNFFEIVSIKHFEPEGNNGHAVPLPPNCIGTTRKICISIFVGINFIGTYIEFHLVYLRLIHWHIY